MAFKARQPKSASAMAGAAALSTEAARLEEMLGTGAGPIPHGEAVRLKAMFDEYRAALTAKGLAA
jgi:hypothetical protein